MTCGQNIASKSVCGVCSPLKPKTDSKQRKAKGGQQPRIDTLFERDSDRRGEQLRHPCDQHDHADLQSVVVSDECEKDGHEINRAEQADAQDETQNAADREASIGEGAEIDDRVRCA